MVAIGSMVRLGETRLCAFILTQLSYGNALSATRSVPALLVLGAAPEVHLNVTPHLQEQDAIDEANRHGTNCKLKPVLNKSFQVQGCSVVRVV